VRFHLFVDWRKKEDTKHDGEAFWAHLQRGKTQTGTERFWFDSFACGEDEGCCCQSLWFFWLSFELQFELVQIEVRFGVCNVESDDFPCIFGDDSTAAVL